MTVPSSIIASGKYIPQRAVANSEFTQFPASSIPLIEQKTGIRTRHYAASDQITSDLACEAARACLGSSGVTAQDIDGIILATSSPDRIQPATATRVQHLLGSTKAFAFDINAVCSGAVHALAVAQAMVSSGQSNRILVIASELYSRLLNPKDFSTYPYFGDGAGAVLVARADSVGYQIESIRLGADGAGDSIIEVPAGGSKQPGYSVTNPSDFYFKMRGREVFNFAIAKGSEVIRNSLNAAGLTSDDLRLVITHQANINIIDAIAKESGVPRERFHVSLDRFGNTAAASVLIGFDEALNGKDPAHLKKGEYGMMVAFGGGLSWGGMLFRRLG